MSICPSPSISPLSPSPSSLSLSICRFASICVQGVTVAGACVSKTLAKASVAPIAETSWGYMGALCYVGLWQVLSLLAGVLYVR